MKTSISRSYTFSAAHRIKDHPKCGRMHGHNYEVIVELTGELNSEGMVLDYGVLDEHMGRLVKLLDHRYLANETEDVSSLNDAEVRILMIPATTAEYLADYIFNQALGFDSRVSAVTVKEGSKSSATVRSENS